MKAKDYLDQGKQVESIELNLIRQIRYCDSEMGNLRSVDFQKEFVTGSKENDNSKDVKLLMLKEEATYKLSQIRIQKSKYHKQVSDCFSKMPEGDPKSSLVYHHLLGKSQRAIGREWGYDHKQIQRFLQRGYEMFPMPETPVKISL